MNNGRRAMRKSMNILSMLACKSPCNIANEIEAQKKEIEV
jgi:hypothetical protein